MHILSLDESKQVKEKLAIYLHLNTLIFNWDLMRVGSSADNFVMRYLIKKSPILGVIYLGTPLWDAIAKHRYEAYLVLDALNGNAEAILDKFATYLKKQNDTELIWIPIDGLTSSFVPQIARGCCAKLLPDELKLLAEKPIPYIQDTYLFDIEARWFFCHTHEGFICIGGNYMFIENLKNQYTELNSIESVTWKSNFKGKDIGKQERKDGK